jgi:hypothetical protein
MTSPMYLEEFTQRALEEISANDQSSSVDEVDVSTELVETSVTRTYFSIKKQLRSGSSSYFSVVAGISNDFSSEQIDIIKSAFTLFAQRGYPDNFNPVQSCIGKYGSSFPRNPSLPFPDSPVTNPALTEIQKIIVAIYSCIGMFPDDKGNFIPQEYRPLLINRFDQDPVADPSTGRKSFTLGKAGVNIYNLNKLLEISLNGKFIGSGSEYPKSTDANVWAGVIAHEILHNLGWEHGSNDSGTYIREYGDCVERNGGDKALGLTTSYDEVCGTVS